MHEVHGASISTDEVLLLAGGDHGSARCSNSIAIAVWWWRRSVLGHGRRLGHWSDRVDHCRRCDCLPAVWISWEKRSATLGTKRRIAQPAQGGAPTMTGT